MYNDHVQCYQTYINVLLMQMQMFAMPNSKDVKRKKNTKECIVGISIYPFFTKEKKTPNIKFFFRLIFL